MNEIATYPASGGVQVLGEFKPEYLEILTPQALEFIANLHREFNPRRIALLQRRDDIQAQINSGVNPHFLTETGGIRQDESWRVAPAPGDLEQRWVEITGPTDRKMLINAFNSGADIYMADFEDANSPKWQNMVEGQIHLRDAILHRISYTSPDGKYYTLNDEIATLMVRPRGWHLSEKHVLIDNEPVSASLFDFGLFFFHNCHRLIQKGTGPYFYLPKLENHLEAKLWNDVFIAAQKYLGIPRGTIRATVLIETVLAAFEMEEILYVLREHSAGLNAGRWDYIFSIIKKFHAKLSLLLPDRAQITMTVPFMRAYTELLVRTCHRRGAHAIGGMAAYIPSRKDPEVNEIALGKVREDKLRESRDGFDGTWVAHPDLVPVARKVFKDYLGEKPHQKDRLREDVQVIEEQLLDFIVPNGTITETGIRQNIVIAILYLESWLRGTGAAAIFNLMEDTATAEISRAQVWQWIHHRAALADGKVVSEAFFDRIFREEQDRINDIYVGGNIDSTMISTASQLFKQLVIQDQFENFLTLRAYDQI